MVVFIYALKDISNSEKKQGIANKNEKCLNTISVELFYYNTFFRKNQLNQLKFENLLLFVVRKKKKVFFLDLKLSKSWTLTRYVQYIYKKRFFL